MGERKKRAKESQAKCVHGVHLGSYCEDCANRPVCPENIVWDGYTIWCELLGGNHGNWHHHGATGAHWYAPPDELTALRQRVAELETTADRRFLIFQSAQNEITGLKAERDALRERIRALADECDQHADEASEQAQTNIPAFKAEYEYMARYDKRHARRLRRLLGDA